MNRMFVSVAFLALATPFAQAQRGMRAAPVFRSAPVVRPVPTPRFAPMPRFAPPAGRVQRGFAPSGFAFGHIGSGGVRFPSVPFCDPSFISCQFQLASRFHRRRRFFNPFFSPFGFGALGAYAGYPLFWDYPQVDYSAATQPAPQPIIIYAQPPEEQEEREPAPFAPGPKPQPTAAPEPMKLPPTVLVFRDQHREEVTNYAIAGDSVYVFTEGRRRKIALSDLDVPATIKVNDERGVEFRVPGHRGA